MRRLLIIAAFLLLPGICLVAQQFPVQVTPQLVAPYTLQVSDYYSPAGNPKLNLLLLLRDFNKPSLQVRLRMSIVSQSVAIATREDVAFTAIEILSGQPKYIQPVDLTEYFNSNNLTFSGITQSQYEQTGKLPEGFYTFCFEMVDVATGQTVSNKGCTIAWLTLNEPPLLNIPRKSESVIPSTPQNLLFQWTPRHTASPTAYNIDYIFSIVEVPDESVSPEVAFLTYVPLYIDSTSLTTYLYDVSKPALVAGKKYAWRVQAKAKNGAQELAMFRNNGYSETFWFNYQNNCPVPVSITADAQGQRVNVTWGSDVQHLQYKVEYRKINTANAAWFELENTMPNVSITDLEPSATYEYRVGAACETGKYIFSPLHQFTTNTNDATTVPECGFDPNPLPTTEPLLQQMNVGDVVKAGDFNVVITRVNGTGSFSGEGYVVVPWLANLKLAVNFGSIGVGTDMKLKIGEIATVYDPDEGLIGDIDTLVDDLRDLTGILKELLSVPVTTDSSYFAKLRESFSVLVDQEVTSEMKVEFQTVLDSMSYYKEQFDDAKNQYYLLPEGVEKDAQRQLMDNAKHSFENNQSKLSDLNSQRIQLVTEVTDLFVNAVKELSLETSTGLSNALEEYNSQKQTVAQSIYDEQNLISEVDADVDLILKGIYTEEIDSMSVPQVLVSFATSIKTFAKKKNNLKILNYVKALENYYVQQNRRDKLKDDIILEGVAMIKELLRRRRGGESDVVIKDYLKKYIKEKILKL